MPKLKRKCRSPGEKVLDVIAYYQSYLCLSNKEFAAKVKIPYATLLRREKEPEKFTVDELGRIAGACGLSLSEFFSNQIIIKE